MSYHQERLATYKTQLHPWCIVRLLLDTELSQRESQPIVCFRHRSDADAHLQILRANNPTASYEIRFNITSQRSDAIAK